MKLRGPVSSALICAAVACTGYDRQSVLDPASPHAASTRQLFYFMIAVSVVVYVVVVGMLLLVIRNRRVAVDDLQSPAREEKAGRIIRLALAVVVPVLFVFLLYDFAVARGVGEMPDSSMLTIEVTGHQWWWEAAYDDPVPHNIFRTANEIHIPVGRPVRIKLASHDVIHSFWVPNLSGKKDLIPGHKDELVIQADRPGIYRGQCAEFCGLEHAKMSFWVVAEPVQDFSRWVERQRQPAPEPTDSITAAGRAVFETGSCATCHTIASTRAAATVGPNLTHIASRLTIAAGALPNNRGNLAGWIVDPQTIKPGAKMPPNSLAPRELQALLAYLETLK
ncbi:MAG TPA: cytochrome c oxidase subunit II [Gemmatimonadaceae bacterium]|nr:cytochrome c oxidase subunit II [Gemmatimonadaceae bacterium]